MAVSVDKNSPWCRQRIKNKRYEATTQCCASVGCAVQKRRLVGRKRLPDCSFSPRSVASKMDGSSKVIVGIDLGTSNSVCSVMVGGKPQVIVNSENHRTTPSVVHYTRDKALKVGMPAKRQASIHPLNTFFSFKRFMGKKFSELTESSKQVPYMIEDLNDRVYLKSPHLDRTLSPEEVSSQVLKKLAKDAEKQLGQRVEQAVITVPAYFNDAQRQATRDAGEIAGLKVKRIVNEPTAACLAYGFGKLSQDTKVSEKVLVFDLGGGTFDVSILDYGDGVFEVKSTSGDGELGGDDFNFLIFNWLVDNFEKENNDATVSENPTALQRLNEACEIAKVALSTKESTRINLPFLVKTYHLNVKLTRSNFDSLSKDLIERCRGPLNQCLNDAKLTIRDIDRTILVGGSTRIPAVKKLITDVMQQEMVTVDENEVNVDEAVALGAAIQSAIISGGVTDMVLLDVTPLSLGVVVEGGLVSVIVQRNTTLPVSRRQIYTTSADGQAEVLVRVVQGERKLAKDNKLLGKFHLRGLKPQPGGVPQIEVSFFLDVNGLLTVKAKEKKTGLSQSVVIKESSNLAKSEIEQIISEAAQTAEDDATEARKIQLKVDGESLIRKTETELQNPISTILAEERTEYTELLEQLRTAIRNESYVRIEDFTSKLRSRIATQVTVESSNFAKPGEQTIETPVEGADLDNNDRNDDTVNEVEVDRHDLNAETNCEDPTGNKKETDPNGNSKEDVDGGPSGL